MTKSRLSWIFAFVIGCGGAAPESPEGSGAVGDAVATYTGGAIGLADIEAAHPEARTPACLAARRAPGGGTIEELMPCYREVAENLVLERLVLAEVEDVEQAVQELERYPQLRRHAYLEAFNRRLNEEIEISDEAIADHFEANRESYRRPGSLSLWNIFRRHEDPSRPEETLEFLRGLKERYEAGETFAALARAYSQSETRLRDGQVGQVSEGQLPARLEKAAFALGDGDVSDPIRVRGGAVLLHVRNVIRGVDLTLQDVERRIRQELRVQTIAERIEQRAQGVQPPDDAVVLAAEELLAALDGSDLEAPVLELEGDRMTVGQARQLAGLGEGQSAAEIDEAARERLVEAYDQRRNQGLLMVDLLASAGPELRAEAEAHSREAGAATLVDERLRGEMGTSDAVDAETLESYYRDNLPHYQSPLRFHLHRWDLPFGADPPRQLERMEELQEALAAGELELAGAVAELGGTAHDLGWRALDELPEITGKARQYLLQTEAGGFSIPYQDDDALHLLWVEAREEPWPLSYEEAAERVREDYLRRFEEPLFRQFAEARLAEAAFVFDEEAVRLALVPGATSE